MRKLSPLAFISVKNVFKTTAFMPLSYPLQFYHLFSCCSIDHSSKYRCASNTMCWNVVLSICVPLRGQPSPGGIFFCGIKARGWWFSFEHFLRENYHVTSRTRKKSLWYIFYRYFLFRFFFSLLRDKPL